MSTPALQANGNVTTSRHQEKVASGAGLDFTAIDLTNFTGEGHVACCGIELLAAGTLSYTDVYGNTRTFTSMTAGYKPISAAAILVATNVDVLVYF